MDRCPGTLLLRDKACRRLNDCLSSISEREERNRKEDNDKKGSEEKAREVWGRVAQTRGL